MSFNINYICFLHVTRFSFLLLMGILLGTVQCININNEQLQSNIEIVDLPVNDAESKGDTSDHSKKDLQKDKNHFKFSIGKNDLSSKKIGHNSQDFYRTSQYQDIPQPPPENMI